MSFILAAVGFAVFWGAAMLAAANLGEGPNSHAEIAAGFGVFLAVVAHLAGIGVAFAAPRGRRLVPVLLNASSLGLIVAVMAAGLAMKR